MPDTDSNGRVTLAVLSTKLDNVIKLLEDYNKDADDRELRLRKLEEKVGRYEERQGVIAGLQAVFTTIAALIAGWFGSR